MATATTTLARVSSRAESDDGDDDAEFHLIELEDDNNH